MQPSADGPGGGAPWVDDETANGLSRLSRLTAPALNEKVTGLGGGSAPSQHKSAAAVSTSGGGAGSAGSTGGTGVALIAGPMGQKERAAMLSPDIVMDVDTVCGTAEGGRGRRASEPLGAHNAWVWVWGFGGLLQGKSTW